MKLPSIQNLKEKALAVIKRFPMAMLTALLITSLGIFSIEANSFLDDESEYIIGRIILSSIFIFPLFASFKLISERKNWPPNKHLASIVGVIILGILFYNFILPTESWQFIDSDGYKIFILNFAAYLFAIYAPFISQKQEQLGIWHYTKTLFVRSALTALSSGILFAGIAISLASIDFLLDINIHEELFADFFIIIAGVLSPLIFFDGVPRKIEALNKEKQLPTRPKTFGQFILIPLVTAYTIILYLYAGKILLTRVWPEGIVSFLIIGFAVSGIATLLILHPFQKLKESKWISIYTKCFYMALVPLTVMLFAAVWIRISDYGITENRYYVVLLGAYLLIISLYFIFSRTKEIKYIPQTLSILLLLSLFGPLSAFNVSANSQTQRLEEILVKHEVLVDGKIIENSHEKPFSDKDLKDIRSIINYLGDNNNYESILPWFEGKIGGDFTYNNKWHKRSLIMESFSEKPLKEGTKHKRFTTSYPTNTKVTGYDQLIEISLWNSDSKKYEVDESSYEVQFIGQSLRIIKDDTDLINIDLSSIIKNLNDNFVDNGKIIPKEFMQAEAENEKLKAKLHISAISGNLNKEEGSFILRELSGKLLLGFE